MSIYINLKMLFSNKKIVHINEFCSHYLFPVLAVNYVTIPEFFMLRMCTYRYDRIFLNH